MGTMANIPATVTEFSVLVIGIRDHTSSIPHHVDLRSIDSVSFMSKTLILRQTSFSLRKKVQFISLTVQFKRP